MENFMNQPEDEDKKKKKIKDKEIEDIINGLNFSMDLSYYDEIKKLNKTIKDMLYGPQLDDTLFKQINNFTDSIFATWGGQSNIPDDNVIFIGKNIYGEQVFKSKYFVVDKLKNEYLNHIRQHATHTLQQPDYYKCMFEILN